MSKMTDALISPPVPAGFRETPFERSWSIGVARERLWDWLNDPKTFTRGQLPPFRVEFLPMPDGRPGGFETGCLNVHHGPGMSFHGVIGEMRHPEYRDLRYSYGSYALSMRLVRPQRLQFFLEEEGPDRTRLRMRLDVHARNYFAPIWSLLNALFWSSFGLSVRLAFLGRTRTKPQVAAPATSAFEKR